MRRTKLGNNDTPKFFGGEVADAASLHIQDTWKKLVGIDNGTPIMLEFNYNGFVCVDVIDCFDSSGCIHIIKFTKNKAKLFSPAIVQWCAYLLFRQYDMVADKGVIHVFDPYNVSAGIEKVEVDIDVFSLAQIEKKLYNLTEKYKILLMN